MRKKAVKIALVAFIPLLFGITEADAQCGPALRAHIPFDFVVNGREAKAGAYIIDRTNCTTASPTVVLRDEGGRSLGIINHSAVELRQRPGSPRVVFEDYGGKRVLTEVHDPKGRYSFRINPGRAETKLARSSKPLRTSVPAVEP